MPTFFAVCAAGVNGTLCVVVWIHLVILKGDTFHQDPALHWNVDLHHRLQRELDLEKFLSLLNTLFPGMNREDQYFLVSTVFSKEAMLELKTLCVFFKFSISSSVAGENILNF